MMARIIDARNLSCPQPVVLTKKALDETGEVTTIVDNEAARDNVVRLGESHGCQVAVELKENFFYVSLKRLMNVPVEKTPQNQQNLVVLIGSDIMGRGENYQLGSLLMQSFLHTISGLTLQPETIIFLNNGVKLVIEDSPGLGELTKLEHMGIEILACGTCLSHLELMDKIAVGRVSNMYTIADTLFRADKIISP